MNVIAEEDLKKIISNFQFLFPDETTAEELDLLFNTNFDLQKADNKKDSLFNLCFYTTPVNYSYIKPNLEQIEQNLMKKAEVVFRWFPACKIFKVIIKPLPV